MARQPSGPVEQLHSRAHGKLQQVPAFHVFRLGRNIQQVEVQQRFAVLWQRRTGHRCIGQPERLRMPGIDAARGRRQHERQFLAAGLGAGIAIVQPHLGKRNVVATVVGVHRHRALAAVVDHSRALQPLLQIGRAPV
ncbi:hypothetical protein G6F62_014834 [Rhizopus arrhizus]|nr:hypothetical protein G6F62_014834 [Rhizopus arrhizus]